MPLTIQTHQNIHVAVILLLGRDGGWDADLLQRIFFRNSLNHVRVYLPKSIDSSAGDCRLSGDGVITHGGRLLFQNRIREEQTTQQASGRKNTEARI
ncbi:MAG: hypothetical protein DMG39_21070 [Acidobacteria bacterium]|nr:MAG: hypothetical protein DMG39_21070 [Acidobacteriota bacterium]